MPLLLLLLEFPELLLLLLELDAFEELGEDVDALFDAAPELDELFALLLLFELLPFPPELDPPADPPPEDCFSFLSLIIIYKNVDHLFMSLFVL